MRKVDRTENGAACFTFLNLKFIKSDVLPNSRNKKHWHDYMRSLWATASQNLLLIYCVIISFKKRKKYKILYFNFWIVVIFLAVWDSDGFTYAHKKNVWAGYLGASVVVCFSFCLFWASTLEPQLKRKCLHWAGLRGIFSVGDLYEKASPCGQWHLWTSGPRVYKKIKQRKSRGANQYAVLTHSFCFSFCLQVPFLSSCPDFSSW